MKTLKEIEREIMLGNVNTQEEWQQLSIDAAVAMSQSSESEIDAFVDSGAGEMLDMIISGFEFDQ